MANFTREQEQAIFTHDKNMIVVAGAGSGKTRVLVERYLDLLDKNRDWRLNALVAITFTREAAFEMRDRVRKELENRVQNPKNEADRRHWSDLLGQMDSARIDTIHGMCATILRANAAEALVDPDFEVLEPIEASALINDIIAAELQALSDNDEANLALLFTEYDMRDIRAALSDPTLLAADLSDMPSDADILFEAWCAEWEAHYLQAVRQVQHQLGDEMNYVAENIFPENDKLADAFHTIRDEWAQFIGNDAQASYQSCQRIIASVNLRSGSKSNWGSQELLKIAKEIAGSIRDSLKKLLNEIGNPPDDLDRKAADLLLRWYQLLRRVQLAYQQSKRDEGYLDFNDLELRTAELLNRSQAVRERYQSSEFKRLLVDEFQDTNQAQWDIVRHLADLDDDVAMFLVGDPKQSIYAFRGADVSVFDGVREQVAQHPKGIKLGLTQSFRSHPGLIEAFNTLFGKILTRDDLSPVAKYEIQFDQSMTAFRQDLPDEQAQIYAPIELLLQCNASSFRSPDFIPSDQRRVWEAHEIAKRLMQFRIDEAPIHDKETDTLRSFDYGDAALLFQSTSHINTYEQVFKAMGVPYVTVAGRGYYNRQEVWDMLNLLKALHNPSDNLSLASALRSPMFGFSDELLLALRSLLAEDGKKRLPLWDALTITDIPHLNQAYITEIERAYEILHDLRQLAGRVTISELLRTALAKTGYLATLTGLPDGARLRRNVEKLVEIAEQSGKITLGAFAHYLDDLTAREVREGEATLDTSGAVRFMTVHASKGLEFPVVVLADTSWTKRGGGGNPIIYDNLGERLACKVFDDDESKYVPSFAYQQASRLDNLRQEAERKRLLYVAATRARDCLIISGEVRQKKDDSLTTYGWLKTITEAIGDDVFDEITDGYLHQFTDNTKIRFHLPEFDPDLIKILGGSEGASQWQKLSIQTEAETPTLMQPIIIEQEKMLGHIAATQLANIGGFHYADQQQHREYYRSQMRRQVLDDAPAQIKEAIRSRDPRIRPRQLGEVVHEALRYWRFPNEHDNIDAILESYAWQQNITDDYQIDDVVQQAHRLLEKFQNSDIYRAIAYVKKEGLPYYSELPFIYRTEKRIIHGVIDALFKNDEEWWLVDYKTSTVRGGLRAIEDHAQRYYLQVGAYASAVRQELSGITPRVFIHYIQYNKSIEIPTTTWEREIQKLERYIGELIG